MTDIFDLQRFVTAQEPVFENVLRELEYGRKDSHWMWFIFPQLKGLGSSPTAVFYAIASGAEAVAYLQHPILGPRLRHCTELVNAIESRTVGQIFGYPDDLKFHSSLTLFAEVADDKHVFQTALDRYFGGKPDPRTLARC